MNRRLNVLVVSAFDIDYSAGGVNTMIRTLCDRLTASCRVVILQHDWNTRKVERYITNGVVRYKLRLQTPYNTRHPIRSLASWSQHFLPNLRSLTKILKDEAIDIVHLHYGAGYQYFFRLTRHLMGVPYVLTLHRGDVMSYGSQSRSEKYLMQFAIRGAHSVVAVSSWLARIAAQELGDLPRPRVVLNGLDFAELDSLRDTDSEISDVIRTRRDYFVIVNNVTRYKGQDVAIRAWAKVREHHPDLQLLIVGEKREIWDECVRLIDDLGCHDTVHLLGEQPRSTAVTLMRHARGVIIPSRSEGLGYVLLEAGALGVPVICSDIGPFMEIAEKGRTAFVTAVEDHSAIADAVNRIIADPENSHAMGNALRSRVRKDFSADGMAKNYLALYKMAVEERAI